jgi:hypothetical protein
MIAYLLDHALAKTASGFVSQLLLSINTSFRLGQPQVNILSKADMLSEKEIEQVKRWSEDSDNLENTLSNEDATVYREMSEKIMHVIYDFEKQLKLFPVGKDNYMGVEDLYAAVQFQFEGGEDLLKD